MSTTDIGRQAETIAADYLQSKGFKIVARNWRTRWCEIDIIAESHKTIYFVEVKYRRQATWGDGLDAITVKKQQQMSFATEFWINQQQWRGEVVLAAISASGEPPAIDEFIELA